MSFLSPLSRWIPCGVIRGLLHAAMLLQATAQGQVSTGGTAVMASDIQHTPLAVRMQMDDQAVAASIPAGATGEAAIFTSSAAPTHVIRRIMLRMTAYLNYVLPL